MPEKDKSLCLFKQHLSHPYGGIRLHDMVMAEAEAVWAGLTDPYWRTYTNVKEMGNKIKDMHRMAEPLFSFLALGAYWGRDEHRDTWRRVLEKLLSNPPRAEADPLYRYLPLGALYVLLAAAMARGRYGFAYALLRQTYCEIASGWVPLCQVLHASAIGTVSVLNTALDGHHEHPVSAYLMENLRRPCLTALGADETYARMFHKVELLISMNYKDTAAPVQEAPLGLFALKKMAGFIKPAVLLEDDLPGLLDAGFFCNDKTTYERLIHPWETK